MIVYIIAALLVFGVLIAVHELGHFLAAKACGVRVNEFAIGMGPALWKKQKGETLYSLRAFPVGGFCAMEGEEEESDDPAALSNQGFWQKLIIFAAGAAMNFLAGLVIIFCLYAPAQGFYQPVISGFAEGCPLESAGGLQTGDRIVAIDGERVYVYSDINLLFSLNKTGVFDLTVERDGQKVQLKDFAMERQTYTDQSGNEYSGYGIYFGAKAATFGDKLAYTWNNAVDFVRMVRLSLQMLLSGQAGLRDLSGPVGIVSTMVQVGEQADVNIAYCPERVLPGQVMVELIKNDRVIGGMTPVCSARASELYKIFLEGECVVTNSRTAEMCKLTENSFRDVNIAFANELSLICADQGINVWELIRLANRHPRVNILQPGPGVGGHCIAVDPWFIVAQNPQQARLIRTAREVNDHKPFWVIDQVKAAVADCLAATDKRASELKIACFGLAFKPNIDDLRESPAMEIAELIAQWHSGETLVVEPNIHQLPKKLTGLCTLAQLDEALATADVLVMLVDHSQFKVINGDNVHQQYVVDAKGVWR
mgnify:CR=1 FL=1